MDPMSFTCHHVKDFFLSTDVGGGGGGDVAAAFGDGVCDIRHSKITRGSDFWFMLLPLNPQRLLREALRKLTTANTNGYICCYHL